MEDEPYIYYKTNMKKFIHSANPHVVTACRNHCFQNLAKQNNVKTMFATGETVGLAEWIIDDTCLV